MRGNGRSWQQGPGKQMMLGITKSRVLCRVRSQRQQVSKTPIVKITSGKKIPLKMPVRGQHTVGFLINSNAASFCFSSMRTNEN